MFIDIRTLFLHDECLPETISPYPPRPGAGGSNWKPPGQSGVSSNHPPDKSSQARNNKIFMCFLVYLSDLYIQSRRNIHTYVYGQIFLHIMNCMVSLESLKY